MSLPSSHPMKRAQESFAKQMAKYLQKEMANRPKGMAYYDRMVSGILDSADEVRKLRESGAKTVGVFCSFAPEELIYASGAFPIWLSIGVGDTVPLADEFLPRNFCPLIKSSVGLMTVPKSDIELPDIVVMPTPCDGKKKSCEILTETLPTLPTWVMEVPHTTESPQARKLWLTEVKILKNKLEEFTGTRITEKRLREAIELSNRKRKAIRRLYEARKATAPPISGRDSSIIIQSSYYDEMKSWIEHTEKLCEELEERNKGGGSARKEPALRIMVSGSPIILPNWKLLNVVEEAGAVIVCDDLCMGIKGLWDLVMPCDWTMESMLTALAERYLMISCPCFTPNYARIDRLLQLTKEFKVDGVIYHVLHSCHIYDVETRKTEKALKEIGIPMLRIETDYGQEDVEQIRTRVEAFIEMIMRKKG